MTNDDNFLLQFWGKTPKLGDPPEKYHPAIYHMLDVAFVAEALLRDGSPRLRQAYDKSNTDRLGRKMRLHQRRGYLDVKQRAGISAAMGQSR